MDRVFRLSPGPWVVLALCVVWPTAAGGAPATRPEGPSAGSVRLRVELTDGSVLVGEARLSSIPLRTAYGKLDISLDRVRLLSVAADQKTASLWLRNDDKLQGTLEPFSLEVDTAVGRMTADLRHIRSVTVSAVADAGGGARIVGRVVNAAGRGVPDTRVVVKSSSMGRALWWAFEPGTRTDAQGRFTIELPFPGIPYGLSAGKMGHYDAHTKVLPDDVTQVTLTLTPYKEPRHLTGRVKHADGRPAADRTVKLIGEYGTFRVTGIPPGRYHAMASSATTATRTSTSRPTRGGNSRSPPGIWARPCRSVPIRPGTGSGRWK